MTRTESSKWTTKYCYNPHSTSSSSRKKEPEGKLRRWEDTQAKDDSSYIWSVIFHCSHLVQIAMLFFMQSSKVF